MICNSDVGRIFQLFPCLGLCFVEGRCEYPSQVCIRPCFYRRAFVPIAKTALRALNIMSFVVFGTTIPAHGALALKIQVTVSTVPFIIIRSLFRFADHRIDSHTVENNAEATIVVLEEMHVLCLLHLIAVHVGGVRGEDKTASDNRVVAALLAGGGSRARCWWRRWARRRH